MFGTLVFLVALVPVLVIGIAMVELLLVDAPRRGKRPDLRDRPRAPRRRLAITLPDGRRLRGTPEQLVAQLARQGFVGAPAEVTRDDAWRLLDSWVAVGRLQLQIEWR